MKLPKAVSAAPFFIVLFLLPTILLMSNVKLDTTNHSVHSVHSVFSRRQTSFKQGPRRQNCAC